MGCTAKQIIATMESWLGMSRSARTHKPIIDLYNSHKPLARGYAVTYSDDYCDTTVSAAFIKNKAVDLIGGTECGVEEHVKLFKKKGIWIEDGTIVPMPGYIIVYNWGTSVQPNDGYSDHIGVVKSLDVKKRKITVIEGNMSGGKVGYRTIPVGWGYIRGYAAPKYDSESTEVFTDDTTTKPSKLNAVVGAKSFDKALAGKYVVSTNTDPLNLRYAPETGNVMAEMPKGRTVQCYGYYTEVKGVKWLLVEYSEGGTLYTGFASGKYLKK